MVSQEAAIAVADENDNGPGSKVSQSLLALVTDSGRLHNNLAWVVTFTWDHPVDMRTTCLDTTETCPPVLQSHDHVVIDATTGMLVLGFGTA
jgi:hypothetical protein